MMVIIGPYGVPQVITYQEPYEYYICTVSYTHLDVYKRQDWDWLAPSGLSTKDFVAPSSLCFGTAKTFGLGGKYGHTCRMVFTLILEQHQT